MTRVTYSRPMARRRQQAEESQGPGVKPCTSNPPGPSERHPLATLPITTQRLVRDEVQARYVGEGGVAVGDQAANLVLVSEGEGVRCRRFGLRANRVATTSGSVGCAWTRLGQSRTGDLACV